MRFDQAVVGRGGAGFAWPASPRDSSEERARFAIAPPLALAMPTIDASSDDEAIAGLAVDEAAGTVALDPEVTASLKTHRCRLCLTLGETVPEIINTWCLMNTQQQQMQKDRFVSPNALMLRLPFQE